jgi:ubiquinone/menaquinone biosynthesis C-methylase UbiE
MFEERLNLDEYNTNIGHVTRYKFVAQFVSDKIVLDVACGCGYGSNLLIESNSSEVFGIDIDPQVIKEAQQSKDNHSRTPEYLVGNAERIPFPDLTVDVVVCFETLEHVNDDKRTIDEIHRVLKQGGILILTTPNAKITQPKNGVPNNPFHVREYTPEELTGLLSSQFNEILLLGQRVRGTVSQRNSPKIIRRFLDFFPSELRQKLPHFLPPSLADWIVRRVTNHSFYLREEDIEIEDWGVEKSPVLIAVCKK